MLSPWQGCHPTTQIAVSYLNVMCWGWGLWEGKEKVKEEEEKRGEVKGGGRERLLERKL